MNFDFYMPVRVVSGRTALADSAAQLKKLGDSCMVVTGKRSAKASGALDDLTEVLRREKISCTVYDGITENPLLSSCEEAAALAAEKKAAFVVGIGGGSPLDAAKAIAALAANPGLDREGFFKKAWKNPPLPIVLIGTTSGTGSEVSPTSVLTVDGVKKSVSGPELYASLAIANPAYTGTMSYNTTVSTGLDAFCHAVEGYFSPACDDITGYLAEKAMPMVYRGLKMMRPEREMTPAFRDVLWLSMGGLGSERSRNLVPPSLRLCADRKPRDSSRKGLRSVPAGFAAALRSIRPGKNGTLSAGVRYGSSGGESAFRFLKRGGKDLHD